MQHNTQTLILFLKITEIIWYFNGNRYTQHYNAFTVHGGGIKKKILAYI